jgi:hypothetical protein
MTSHSRGGARQYSVRPGNTAARKIWPILQWPASRSPSTTRKPARAAKTVRKGSFSLPAPRLCQLLMVEMSGNGLCNSGVAATEIWIRNSHGQVPANRQLEQRASVESASREISTPSRTAPELKKQRLVPRPEMGRWSIAVLQCLVARVSGAALVQPSFFYACLAQGASIYPFRGKCYHVQM